LEREKLVSAIDVKFLRSFQDHLLAKLLSEPLLNSVAIVSFRKQILVDVAKRVAPHLAGRNGKVGSGILINLPAADPTDDDIGGAQMTANLALDILNMDNVALPLSNGSGLTAEEIVVSVWLILHQWLNQAIGSGNWFVSGFDPIEDQKGAYGYRLILTVRFAADEPAKCANVTSGVASGYCTLNCATAGATIYYTLDGSFPGPGNAAALVYAAPFVVNSGQSVLAAAFITNSTTTIGSDVWLTNVP
jgi:hypothetical protein